MTLIPYLFLRLRPARKVVRYMCKKSCFPLPFQKEHGKLLSTHFKFQRQQLQHIYWSTGRQLSCKKSLLVIWESLRLFLNTMSAFDKCSLRNRNNLMQPIHMQLSQKLKTFCSFILHFRNLGYILDIFRKKITLIGSLFLRLRPAKSVVRYMCKSPASDYPSKRNMVNWSRLCLNLSDSTCSIIFAQRESSLVAKRALLVICQRLWLFVNTMTVIDKYSLPNRDNLMQPIHMQLSQKLKLFLALFCIFKI